MTTWEKLKSTTLVNVDKQWVWKQICAVCIGWKKGDAVKAKKMALAQYRKLYGEWPPESWEFDDKTEVEPMIKEAMHNDLKELWSKKRKLRND